MSAVAELKLAHRAIWAAGDPAAAARCFDQLPSRDLVARMDIRAGQRVLDVATGTGTLAVRAAAVGARVVGLDFVPELLDTARARAVAAGVTVDWVEGDAERLPWAEGSFDCVLSTFGVQFAPRHEVVAHELTAACRRGGRIGVVNWTPESLIGELLQVLASYEPAPPPFASPPPLWGSASHVRRLFHGCRVVLDFDRGHNPVRFPSPEAWMAFMETSDGPTVRARERLAAKGRWEECRAELLALARRHNKATDGTMLMRSEYLIAVGRKAG